MLYWYSVRSNCSDTLSIKPKFHTFLIFLHVYISFLSHHLTIFLLSLPDSLKSTQKEVYKEDSKGEMIWVPVCQEYLMI